MYEILTVVALGFFIFRFFFSSSKKYFVSGRHVLITGGSSGIGLALAMEARKHGANVTIVARNTERLKDAERKILEVPCENRRNGWVNTLSLNIAGDWKQIERDLKSLVEERGAVHVLINCAGYAEAHYFEDGSEETFEKLMKLNYFGSVAVTKALLPSMREDAKKEAGSGGCICFISSMAGQLGVFGYSGYCGSKFALRGLAETLYWELIRDGISVTLAFPPDTKTPGYELEQRGKPIETMAISEAAGLLQPEVVAKRVFQDVVDRRFFSGMGFDGFILTTLSAGMAPTDSLSQTLLRAFVSGPLQLVAHGYRFWIRNIIQSSAPSNGSSSIEK